MNKKQRKVYRRARHLETRYNLTQEEYLAMVKEQRGRCKICRRRVFLCIDHDHETRVVRGLLCRRCNSHLGWYDQYGARIQSYVL